MAAQVARELCVPVGYGRIAGKIWGDLRSHGQKFLAVHGFLDNAGSFDPLMRHFASKGYPYSPVSELQAMRQVIKHLGWQKYHIIGHSLGGFRSQEYALAWNHEVLSVTLLDALLYPWEQYSSTEKYPSSGNPYTNLACRIDDHIQYETEYHGISREHTWEELRDRWLAVRPGATVEDFNQIIIRACKRLDNGKYIYNRDVANLSRLNVVMKQTADMMRQIYRKHSSKMNILAIVPTHGKLTEYGEDVRSFIPQLKEYTIEGTHYLHMQKPKEVSDILNSYLSSIHHRQHADWLTARSPVVRPLRSQL